MVCVKVDCGPLDEEETERGLEEGGDDVDDGGDGEERVGGTWLQRVGELHCRGRRTVFFQ